MENELVKRKNSIIKVNIIGIITNVALAVVKFTIGLIVHSSSIIADSLNNITDSLNNLITIVGSNMSLKPADEDHPFGHGRIEYIAAFIVSFLVFQVGALSLFSSVKKFFEKNELILNNYVFIVLIISIVVKLLLSLFYKTNGNKLNSDGLVATAMDSFQDAFLTFGTLVSMSVFKFFGMNIDVIVGALISLIIVYNSIKILKTTIEPLIGEKPDRELYKKIKEFVNSYDEIIDTHDLLINNYGVNKYMCSIHVEVDKNKDIEYLHEIIDRIEKDINEKMGISMCIHLDPVDLHNEKINEYKLLTQKIVNKIQEEKKFQSLNFHDFRCVFGVNNTNLVFDLVIPWGLKDSEIEELKEDISKRVKEYNPHLSVVMNIDNMY